MHPQTRIHTSHSYACQGIGPSLSRTTPSRPLESPPGYVCPASLRVGKRGGGWGGMLLLLLLLLMFLLALPLTTHQWSRLSTPVSHSSRSCCHATTSSHMTLISLGPPWEMTVVLKGKQAGHCRGLLLRHTTAPSEPRLVERTMASSCGKRREVQCGVAWVKQEVRPSGG